MAVVNSCSTITFDPAIFRVQFPAFADTALYPDSVLLVYWDMAVCYISDESCGCGMLQGSCRRLALNLMLAHLLTLAAQAAGGSGVVVSASIAAVSVDFLAPMEGNSWHYWLNLSSYGRQLLALLSISAAGGAYIGGRPELSAFGRTGGVFW